MNCTFAEGTDEGNIMENGVMSLVEGVGLVVSRSVCLCCVVFYVQFGVAGLFARLLKVQMKATLWRLGSCQLWRCWA